jgi:MFS superfamily sulfate permease-like transporter
MSAGTISNRLAHDGPAGLVVYLVALPLCLGIALGSGAPLFGGIVSGIVGGVVVGLLSGSQVSVSGPAPMRASSSPLFCPASSNSRSASCVWG